MNTRANTFSYLQVLYELDPISVMRSTRGSTFDPIRSSPFYQHPLTPNSQDVVGSGDTARTSDIVMNGTNVGYNTAMQDSHQVLSLGIDSPEYAKGILECPP